ncbi:SPFH domain-containing protein [Solilutibacter silvestris]|uniref:SPFH domain-containing protein n=1 Tax=Solilutibacter silvestris TaxID=1645665 RepID=A0A2K1Q3Q9_9GAMM|nr:SPFH domain-containing protein [Lysobacter silvestris]PNS09690.1 SPFH domain-containing protein [Lysobacter silvestris]
MAWTPPGKHSDPVDAPARPRLDLRGWLPGGSWLWTGIVLGAWLALSSVVVVGAGRQAVISRLGQPLRVVQPGVHFKLPWPLERATGIDIGGRQSIDDTLPVVVGDPAMFDLPLQVGYTIDDPLRYLSNSHEVVQDALRRMVRDAVSTEVVAGSLATLGGRDGQLSVPALTALQARVQHAGLGVKPLSVTWSAPVLPGAVRDSGETLKTIQDEQARALADVKAEAEKQSPATQAEADAMLAAAERDRAARVLDAQGDAAHYRALAAQYRASPLVTRDVVLQGAVRDSATINPAPATTTVVASSPSPALPTATDSVRPQRDDSRKVDRSVDRRRPEAGGQR